VCKTESEGEKERGTTDMHLTYAALTHAEHTDKCIKHRQDNTDRL